MFGKKVEGPQKIGGGEAVKAPAEVQTREPELRRDVNPGAAGLGQRGKDTVATSGRWSAPTPRSTPAEAAPTPSTPGEERKLVVGRGICLKGEVTSCEVLVIEGQAELSTKTRQIRVAPGGVFLGSVEVDEADISGRFEGELTARRSLTVRSDGRVAGHSRYGSIVIESGGQIAGQVEVIDPHAERADRSERKEQPHVAVASA